MNIETIEQGEGEPMNEKPSLRAVFIREGLVRPLLALNRVLSKDNARRQRIQFERTSKLTPNPAGLRIERTALGGVPAEVLTPRNERGGGALMYIHGGGYLIGSPRTHRAMVARLAIHARMRAYLPDYRLAPEHPFPAALDDCVQAWYGLQQREARLVLAGESAGGGLCVALCQRIVEDGLRPPERVYLLSPWLDLSLEQESYTTRNHLDPMLKTGWLKAQFVAPYAAGADTRQPGISPIYGRADGFPPTLIHVGTHEILHDEALAWSEKLKDAGVTVQVHVGRGLWHAWPFFAPVVPEANRALRQAGHWLRL